MYKVDLNSDLGESFGRYTLGMDADILPLVSSANVACGYHASDPLVMDKTIAMAKEAGVVMTGAGATYPYGKDPKDSNIRIAPSFPPIDELEKAAQVFVVCVKLASVEKLLAE